MPNWLVMFILFVVVLYSLTLLVPECLLLLRASYRIVSREYCAYEWVFVIDLFGCCGWCAHFCSRAQNMSGSLFCSVQWRHVTVLAYNSVRKRISMLNCERGKEIEQPLNDYEIKLPFSSSQARSVFAESNTHLVCMLGCEDGQWAGKKKKLFPLKGSESVCCVYVCECARDAEHLGLE